MKLDVIVIIKYHELNEIIGCHVNSILIFSSKRISTCFVHQLATARLGSKNDGSPHLGLMVEYTFLLPHLYSTSFFCSKILLQSPLYQPIPLLLVAAYTRRAVDTHLPTDTCLPIDTSIFGSRYIFFLSILD
jgi:hypothetical protein